MYFILRYFYPDLPESPVYPKEFESEYLADTGELGKIYLDWLSSFETDFVEPGAGVMYRRKVRSQFAAEAMKQPLMKIQNLIFVVSLELD